MNWWPNAGIFTSLKVTTKIKSSDHNFTIFNGHCHNQWHYRSIHLHCCSSHQPTHRQLHPIVPASQTHHKLICCLHNLHHYHHQYCSSTIETSGVTLFYTTAITIILVSSTQQPQLPLWTQPHKFKHHITTPTKFYGMSLRRQQPL